LFCLTPQPRLFIPFSRRIAFITSLRCFVPSLYPQLCFMSDNLSYHEQEKLLADAIKYKRQHPTASFREPTPDPEPEPVASGSNTPCYCCQLLVLLCIVTHASSGYGSGYCCHPLSSAGRAAGGKKIDAQCQRARLWRGRIQIWKLATVMAVAASCMKSQWIRCSYRQLNTASDGCVAMQSCRQSRARFRGHATVEISEI